MIDIESPIDIFQSVSVIISPHEKGFTCGIIDPKSPTDRDVCCAIMGESGVDVKLSRFAQGLFPFSIECKNKETWKGLYDAYDQAISNADLEPVVVLKMNKRDPLIVLDFKKFVSIIKESNMKTNLGDLI